MMHRAHRTLGVGLLCAVIVAVAATGWTWAPPQLPSVDEIVSRHLEAIGGRDAVLAHSSTRATGTIDILGQGLSGAMTAYGEAPNKVVIVMAFEALGFEIRQGFDGEVGWAVDPMTGERLLQDGELQQLIDEADFYSDLHDPEKFTSMEVVEETEFAGKQAYKVRLVYKSGRESFEYFDVDTGLLAGVEGVQESVMGSLNVVTVLENYQEFGDLMVPTRMTQELGPGQTIQVTIDSIEFDNVEASVFDLPAAIKALIQ